MTPTALRRAGAAAAAALALAACSTGEDEQPPPAPPGAEETGGSDYGAGEGGGTAGSDPAGAGGAGTADGPLAFTATTLAGERLDAATLAGEPVVLWFWAPWCTICRAEAPEVAAAAEELEGRVTVLGVAGRGPEDDMRSFVDDTGTGGVDHLVDADGSLWGRFGVVAQPAYAFVAPDGATEVFAGALGGEELRERAEALAAG